MVVEKNLRFADTAEKRITSPFFKPIRSRGTKYHSEKKMDAMLASLSALSITKTAPVKKARSSFLYFPDLLELQHMVSVEDQATSANAARLSSHLREAELTFSELVSAHAYCGEKDESNKWLDELSSIDSSPEDYINCLMSRIKELMRECRLDFRTLESAKTACLAATDADETAKMAETDSWLEEKAADIARARFTSEDDCKDVTIVFNHRDSSFMEIDSTSMCREDIRVSCIDASKLLVYAPHKKTIATSDILREIATRYISDDQFLYIYTNPDALQCQLTKAYIHITDAVLFLWFSYV